MEVPTMAVTPNGSEDECCKNCYCYKELETWTYSDDGVEHKTASGFACLCFIDEGTVVNLVGVNENEDICENFRPKKKMDEIAKNLFEHKE